MSLSTTVSFFLFIALSASSAIQDSPTVVLITGMHYNILAKRLQISYKLYLIIIIISSMILLGCSSGIGKSAVLEFAKYPNYKIWATMRSIDSWDLPDHENIRVAPLDVTSEDSINKLVKNIIEEDKKIDILVNNAGYGIAGALELVTIEEAKTIFDVNVWGVVRM